MININEWAQYIHKLAMENVWIKHDVMVVDVVHLKDKIKELNLQDHYPLLVGVIPSSSSGSMDEDNISEMESCMLLVLTPIERNFDSDIEVENFSITQQALTEIKRTIRQDYFNCEEVPLLRDVKFKSFSTDPEWNILGLMGWSFRFDMETDEFMQ